MSARGCEMARPLPPHQEPSAYKRKRRAAAIWRCAALRAALAVTSDLSSYWCTFG